MPYRGLAVLFKKEKDSNSGFEELRREWSLRARSDSLRLGRAGEKQEHMGTWVGQWLVSPEGLNPKGCDLDLPTISAELRRRIVPQHPSSPSLL